MVTLVILDGFGVSKDKKGNAIKLQGTPMLDKLKGYPKTLLNASGEFVGLPKGQMGNSEVGHLNLGAGKVVYQDLPKINNSILSGEFKQNKAINETINHVLAHNSTLHIMGLASDGGVHSHINHLYALVDLAHEKGVEYICLHLITDGRDTPPNSAKNYVRQIEDKIKGKAKICSIIGRTYAMDRENRWDRVEKAYDMLCLGRAENFAYDAVSAIEDSYEQNIFDEFIEPTIIGPAQKITRFDGVIFFNYRTDRARELTQAITADEFSHFDRAKLSDIKFCTMTEYADYLTNTVIAFPPEKIENNLSAILSKNGLKQFHISETTKYAHVTFFFNGGIEKAYNGEDRKLIESENVKDFSSVPNMKAYEITDEVLQKISSGKYDFILVNLSNADMIGHTGNLESAKQAVKCVDKCAYAIALATLMAGGDCIITADHGNIEQMLDKKGNVITSHTTNQVPFWLVSEKLKKAKLIKNGALCNVAPTVLELLGLEIPKDMEKHLIKF